MNFYAQAIRWLWIVWALCWFVSAFSTKKTVRRQSLGSMLKERLFLLPGYALLFLPYTPAELNLRWIPAAPWIQGAAVGLCALGLAYSIWARLSLGSNWSGTVTLKRDHELIQIGPYALSRHPIYTGLLCATLGLALELGTLGGMLGFVLVVVAFHLKLAVEEGFMREQFGEKYAEYAAKVKKLVPFVY